MSELQPPPDPSEFELLAASLRADARDLPAFLEVFSGKLEDALPGMVVVERTGGLFARRKQVQSIDVSVGDRRFTAVRHGAGVETAIAHEVRGVRLSAEVVPLDAWLSALGSQLSTYAAQSTAGWTALKKLLG